MSEEVQQSTGGMGMHELEAEMGGEQTDREAMPLVNANLASPINAAVAANVLSDNSVAHANAEQNIGDINQSN